MFQRMPVIHCCIIENVTKIPAMQLFTRISATRYHWLSVLDFENNALWDTH